MNKWPRTPEQITWYNIKQRCNNPKASGYNRYGGRGIKACQRWSGKDGFKHFLKDMGPKPLGMTIERKDNEGDYSPDNCIWASRIQQCKNTRQTVLLTIRGKTMCMRDWEREAGLCQHTIAYRLKIGIRGEELLVPPHPGNYTKRKRDTKTGRYR